MATVDDLPLGFPFVPLAEQDTPPANPGAGSWRLWISDTGALMLTDEASNTALGGGSTAAGTSYDNTASGLTADDVQAALDEIAALGGGGGGGAGHVLDVPESELHATYGDHFTGSDLDTGKWTRRGSYVDADDVALVGRTGVTPTYLRVTARAAGSFYTQPSPPSGDFTVVMKCICYATGTAMFGIFAVDNSGVGVGAGFYNSSPNAPIVANIGGTSPGGIYQGGFQEAARPSGTDLGSGIPVWFRLRKVGTNWYVSASRNGETWAAESPALSNSTTITRLGFGLFFNSGVAAFDLDFFDVQ